MRLLDRYTLGTGWHTSEKRLEMVYSLPLLVTTRILYTIWGRGKEAVVCPTMEAVTKGDMLEINRRSAEVVETDIYICYLSHDAKDKSGLGGFDV